jgi:hypothetical protein
LAKLWPRLGHLLPFYAGRNGGEDSRTCTAKPSEPCHEYRHKKAVWVENSTKVLDYGDADERFNSASFKDGMEEQRVVINKNALSIRYVICCSFNTKVSLLSTP